MKKFKTADDYFLVKSQWEKTLNQLRKIILSTELTETLKWGMPTYTLDGINVAGLVAFKSFVAIWFLNGVFLKDKQKKLINAQEGVTKALRQWRFSSVDEIEPELMKAYIDEAINNQQAGKTIKPAKNKPLILPELLTAIVTFADGWLVNFTVKVAVSPDSVVLPLILLTVIPAVSSSVFETETSAGSRAL